MGNRTAAHGEFAEKGLHVADRRRGLGAGGRIAHMADRQRTGQGFHHPLLGEIVTHIAKAMGAVEPLFGIMGDDAAGLLPAMLQRVQAKGNEIGGIRDSDHAENAAFFMQAVGIEGMGKERLHHHRLLGLLDIWIGLGANLGCRTHEVTPHREDGAHFLSRKRHLP